MHGEGLVFAGGVPRSGLTLLRAVANAHPEIFSGPDTNLAAPFAMQMKDFSQNLGGLHKEFFNLPRSKVRTNFAAFIENMLSPVRTASGKRILIEKSPLNVLAFEPLSEMLPNAKFIHVVRDGRDVVASLLARDWRKWRDPATGAPFAYVTDASASAGYWAGLAGLGYNAEKQINDSDRVFVLRYEALVSFPKETCQQLCKFLNVEFSSEMLHFYEQKIDLYGIECESQARLNNPISIDSIGRYERELTRQKQNQVENQCAALLEAFGYR